MKFSASLALSALYASAALAGPVLRVRQDDSNDDDLLSSPTNGTSIAPGGNISFTFRTNDDDTDAVRVALVQVREVRTGSSAYVIRKLRVEDPLAADRS